ncbi:MAG: TonB-dependent receptor [Chitinophagaceae bacterium]|nr:TonB-dependent receptor [Chitinophagaceae bacterium]
MVWIIFVSVFTLSGTITAFAQTCRLTLSGSVSDADTKSPLADAYVELIELKKTTVTDEEGHYHFYNLCPGNYTLKITHVDCEPVEIKVRLVNDAVRNVVLPHRYYEMEKVIISGKKDEFRNLLKEQLENKSVEQTRGLSLGEVLKKINGVTVLQTGSTIFKPVIHGLHGQRLILLNNGVRVEGQQWGQEHAPEIDPYLAEKFTVIKGAGALKYGSDAIGGAIFVDSRTLSPAPGWKHEVNIGYLHNNRQYILSALTEHRSAHVPALGFRLQGTLKYGGNTRTPDYWLYNTGLRELNYSATLEYRKPRFRSEFFLSAFNTQLGLFTGAHIGNLTDLENAIRSPKPIQNIDRFDYSIGRPKQKVNHYLFKSYSEILFSTRKKMSLLLSHQENFRKEFDRALITDRPELDLNIGTSQLHISYEYNRPNLQWMTGLNISHQQNVWDGSRFFIPNFITWNLGAYGILKKQLKNLTLESGIRYDFRDLKTFRNQNNVITETYRKFHNLSTSAVAALRISQCWKSVFNFSLAWRPPHVNELYVNGLHHGTASFEIGDPGLRSERAYKTGLQLKYETDSNWNVDVTLYHDYIVNFINLVPSTPPTLTLRGAYPTFRYIQTRAGLSGADLRFSYWLHQQITVAAKGAFLFARDLNAKDWLMQMPPHRVEGEISYLFKEKKLKNTTISLLTQYVFRQRYIPRRYDDYLPPPADYILLSLEFATELQIFKKNFNFGLSMYNLLNRRYRDYMNRFRYFHDETGRNAVLRLKIPL